MVQYQMIVINVWSLILWSVQVLCSIPSLSASVVRLTLVYFWPLWPESVLQVLSIRTAEDVGCDCRYSL